MNQVFEETEFAGLKLKNRIIRSATFEAMGDKNGRPSEKLAELYVRLAKGGVGAIITGAVSIQQGGKLSRRSLMLHSDEYVEDFKKITSPVKEYGTPLIVQLVHAGGQTNASITGTDVVGPSKKKYVSSFSEARELTDTEIQGIINDFVGAIQRAKRAGFDGVQLHAAHGYLLSAFLSPNVNKRKDLWGGNTENRFRIIHDIVTGVRTTVGNYPILVKFSAYDGDKYGVSIEEGIKIVQLLEKAGVDAIEISCGSADDGFSSMRIPKVPTEAILHFMPKFKKSSFPARTFYKAVIPFIMKKQSPLHNYNVGAAHAIKKQVGIPVIVVGGIRNINDIRSIVTALPPIKWTPRRIGVINVKGCGGVSWVLERISGILIGSSSMRPFV
jgi:2,4-dienoyl-CoA reductase-like NADH-dependent reductase (Old Yellow Enzyme family)